MSHVSIDANVSAVASSASAVSLLANTNLNRRGASIFNDSTQVLYLMCGNGVPTTSLYTSKVAPGGLYETPWNFKGPLKGIWASANGNALVTEFV